MINMNKLFTNDISRFCVLVTEINELNDDLNKQSADFYDGGYSFEEVYQSDLAKLQTKQEELRTLLKEITKCSILSAPLSHIEIATNTKNM